LEQRATLKADRCLANIGEGPHFDYLDVGLGDYLALVEGDTAFWSLIHSSETPSAVYFNPTERCNLNCTYCYLPEPMRRDGTQMSPDEVWGALEILQEHFIATLPEGARPQVVFHGSEPLLAQEAIFQAKEGSAKSFASEFKPMPRSLMRRRLSFCETMR
jgi:uncharacterized protein